MSSSSYPRSLPGLPECSTFSLQVSIPNISSGIVVITVSGFSVPVGPQNYSLAVQGAFTGELESPYNPGWSGIVASRCRLPITTITAGPATFSNASTASLSFNASEGAARPLGHAMTVWQQPDWHSSSGAVLSETSGMRLVANSHCALMAGAPQAGGAAICC